MRLRFLTLLFATTALAIVFAVAQNVRAAVDTPSAPDQPQPPERTRVLIRYKKPVANVDSAQVKQLGQFHRSYHTLPIISAELTETAINIMKKNPRVEIVEADAKAQAFAAEEERAWGVSLIGATSYHNVNQTGQGIKVAVVDSGLDYTHPELQPVYAGGYDFANGDANPMDDNGHGTHVSGIVAAANNDVGVVGTSPGISLYGVKVLDRDGSGWWSDILAGLEWARDQGIPVVNLSLGSNSHPGSIVEDTMTTLNSQGMLFVVAAGNSGNNNGTGDNVSYPARFPFTLSVGSTNRYDQRSSFSSTGPSLDLVAPGESIESTKLGGGYVIYSGTSMATPHVSGGAALLLFVNPNLTNTELTTILTQYTVDLGASGYDYLYGAGRLLLPPPSGEITPPPPPEPIPEPLVSISNITYSLQKRYSRDRLTVTLHAQDTNAEPVAYADVYFTLRKDNQNILTNKRITTNSAGNASYTYGRSSRGCYTTVINQVDATDLVWDGATPTNSFCY